MKRMGKFAVSLALLGALIWWTEWNTVLNHLRQVSLGWLALALSSLTAITLLMAKRWQIVARSCDIHMGYGHAVGEYYIAQLVNTVLPGGVVGDAARAVRIRNAADLTRAAQSVLADRIIGQVAMFAALSVGLVAGLSIPGGLALPVVFWWCVAACLALAGVTMVAMNYHRASSRFISLVFRLLGDRRVLLLSVMITALLILSLYACARATGTMIPPSGWLTIIPLILSAMLIPLSVAGWGWREGAAAALFPLVGSTSSAGVAMGITYGTIIMITALPGLYFMTRSTASLSQTSIEHMETQ